MKARLAVLWQYLIPQRLVCRTVYHAARSTQAWLARPLTHWFAGRFGIDLAEAERSRIDDYDSLNALFTRALAPGTRPIASGSDAVVAPADGRLTQCGRLRGHTLIQAKGFDYSLPGLVGEPVTDGFRDGSFATIYLAPHNYHRVHLPVAGELRQTRYIPGARFSVNTATAAGVPNLFSRNERAVLTIDTGSFAYYVVMVGALNVSSISTVTRGEIPSGRAGCWSEASPTVFATGAEIGRFNMGSTVVLAFPRDAVRWLDDLPAGSEVRMGRRLGSLTRS
jgi:phosphatidylserine decarboxylase